MSTPEERPDLSEFVTRILDALELAPDDVAQLLLRPDNTVTATVYKRNTEGAKYLDEGGDPATTQVIIAAATRPQLPEAPPEEVPPP